MSRVAALIKAGHPGPSLAITALVTLLVAQAARRGVGPVLVAPAILAGQLSVGWSNDVFDAGRDAAAGRTDKPLVTGATSPGAVWLAAVIALAASLGMSVALGTAPVIINAVMVAAAWAYNAGLKSTLASGLMYLAGFAPIPAFATSTLPGHPLPRWSVTVAAGAVGLGAHFANVLPDLAGDRATGVRGLPQQVAARWGPGAVRAVALVLLLGASALLLVASSRSRRWVAVAGLGVAALLAVVAARGTGRVPFLAAIGIAAIDVALFAAGGETLT